MCYHYRQLPLTLALTLSLLSQYALPTLANTEIINFSAGDPVPIAPLPPNWTVLHAGTNEIVVRDRTPAPLRRGPRDSLCEDDEGNDLHPSMRRPCPHELWLALDLDGDLDDGKRDRNAAWKGRYDRYTLRVSWPASHPVQVALSLHRPQLAPPSTSSAPSVRTTRLHFARIRLAQEGIRVPRNAEERGTRTEDGDPEEEGEDGLVPVPLVVTLEPLAFGVLPISVLPAAAALLLLSVLGVWGVLGATTARVRRDLGEVVGRARRELGVVEESGKEGKERKER